VINTDDYDVVHINIYVCTYVYMRMTVDMYDEWIYIYIYIYICMYVYIYEYVNEYICV
jgi:hypothetical protein